MLLDLLRNIALLIALTVIQQTIARHWRGTPLTRRIVSGVVFGVVAVLGMMTPVRFAEGVIYDGRSIILSVGGLFAGPLAALIAALIAGAYRVYLGGSGALVGTAVIVESAALGAAGWHLHRRVPSFMRAGTLWLFGVIVHAAMLLTQLALPGGLGIRAFLQLWPMVLGVYPLGSLLVCRIFLDQEERRRAEHEMRRLNESLERLVEERTVALASTNRRLARALGARTRFLRSMSHELRTPLNSIIGFSDILIAGLTGPLSDEQRKQVRLINDSGRHLLEIVNDILDLARVEAGRVELHPVDIDAVSLACELVESMQPQAARKALDLRLATPDERIELCSDRLKLRQILLDLLGNAVKYTDRGSIELTVGRAGPEVVFVVRDTGRGIRPEMLERVFDEFSRGDDDLEAPREGSGLGLPIARALAQALGGRLTVESAPGEGSAFTLTVPAEFSAPQTPEG